MDLGEKKKRLPKLLMPIVMTLKAREILAIRIGSAAFGRSIYHIFSSLCEVCVCKDLNQLWLRSALTSPARRWSAKVTLRGWCAPKNRLCMHVLDSLTVGGRWDARGRPPGRVKGANHSESLAESRAQRGSPISRLFICARIITHTHTHTHARQRKILQVHTHTCATLRFHASFISFKTLMIKHLYRGVNNRGGS
jgi:hypothetical protein